MAGKFDLKMLGGMFLIVGTTIGVGMLALPVATATSGFYLSSLLLVVTWALMTFSAFLILEVSMWFPSGSNMITMAKETLGKPGEIAAWIIYSCLFYALLSAYISGGTDVLQGLLKLIGVSCSETLCSILFLLPLATVVYLGIQTINNVNLLLMTLKLSVYVAMVSLALPHVNIRMLHDHDFRQVFTPLMFLVVSFGFAPIIPSLRSYYQDDVSKLRKVILIGSLIPLVCYLLWDAAVMGVIPRLGDGNLVSMLKSQHTTTDLTAALSHHTGPWITDLFRFFSSISMLTAFLGVSLSLSDFICDGFHLKKIGLQALLVYIITFLPSLLIVIFYPGIFISALSYGGYFCVLLLILLPLFMTYSGRYIKHIAHGYQVFGGRPLLVVSILVALAILVIGSIQNL